MSELPPEVIVNKRKPMKKITFFPSNASCVNTRIEDEDLEKACVRETILSTSSSLSRVMI